MIPLRVTKRGAGGGEGGREGGEREAGRATQGSTLAAMSLLLGVLLDIRCDWLGSSSPFQFPHPHPRVSWTKPLLIEEDNLMEERQITRHSTHLCLNLLPSS